MSTINANKTTLFKSIPNGTKWAKPVKVLSNVVTIGVPWSEELDLQVVDLGEPRDVFGVYRITGDFELTELEPFIANVAFEPV